MSRDTGIFKDNHFLLLAPANARIPKVFSRVEENVQAHETWRTKLQQLRGKVFLEDGAIKESHLDEQGRHISKLDINSWHFLVMSPEEQIRGVMRTQIWYYDDRLPELCELNLYGLLERMQDLELRQKFTTALNNTMHQPNDNTCFMEVSALAVDAASQGFTIGSMLGISGYSIGNIVDAYVAFGAGTDRHHTARFYHKLGGISFRDSSNPEVVLPPFFDTGYNCQMDIMAFFKDQPTPAIKEMITIVEEKLCAAQVYVNR
ncbi:MAG: hypothetical protein RLZZ156_1146 [Deinococcota bacterium]|jgi:hypothetical protein